MGVLDLAWRDVTVSNPSTHRIGRNIYALHILLHTTQVLIFFAQVVI